MGVNFATRRAVMLGTYADKVLGYDPVAYWPLNELNGTAAHCLTDARMNGTYSSDVSTWPVGTGIGDGHTAPYFDGTNDYINCQTATLTGLFSGTEGTWMQWFRVTAAIWADGIQRYGAQLYVDNSNFVQFIKQPAANTLAYNYKAGNVLEQVGHVDGTAPIIWLPIALTWSASADQVKAYISGAQTGATQTVLGVWAGNLAFTVIGAASLAPAAPWKGWLAHCAVWDRVLTLSDIADLATV